MVDSVNIKLLQGAKYDKNKNFDIKVKQTIHCDVTCHDLVLQSLDDYRNPIIEEQSRNYSKSFSENIYATPQTYP